MNKILPVIALLIASFVSTFFFYSYSLNESLRYRPLANGWASTYAEIYTDDSLQFNEKIEKVLSDDFAHGRFRPAFSAFIASSYLISPIIHGRLADDEDGRGYFDKMNGDLRLFTVILLSSVSCSIFLISFLIYRLTGIFLFSLIPILFIPLSPALTENLLFSFIDSQEIPMVLLLCFSLFFFYVRNNRQHIVAQVLLITLSYIFLFLAFCMKETMVIFSVAAGCVLCCALYSRKFSRKSGDDLDTFSNYAHFLYFILAVALTTLVLFAVSTHSSGYATAYDYANIDALTIALKRWFGLTSKYSLVNIYAFIPIVVSWIILYKNKSETIGRAYGYQQGLLQFMLCLLSIGFFLILLPWNPVLIKYVYPSIFFFSFAIAHALSIIGSWGKQRFGNSFYIVIICMTIPYVVLFSGYRKDAEFERSYWLEQTNYGVRVIDPIAKIIKTASQTKAENGARQIYIGFGQDGRWQYNVQWPGLQLMRILNLDYGFNIINNTGNIVDNLRMPKGELSSFIQHDKGPKVYISERSRELKTIRFDQLFFGYRNTASPEESITYGDFSYTFSGIKIPYTNNVGLENFIMYEYK